MDDYDTTGGAPPPTPVKGNLTNSPREFVRTNNRARRLPDALNAVDFRRP
ncbi:MAG: hypothetical protein FWB80_05160 [Defluviitaleaceae bacterium]|nr:hypothetical protein [Defluviitaleaceae bacterium]